MLLWFCEVVFSLESFLIFTQAFNKYRTHGHLKEMHRLYASMCFRLINFIPEGHCYLSRKDGKYIFRPFLTLVSCHIIVTGHNTQAKPSFLFNVFSPKSQNKTGVFLVFQDSLT